MRKVLFVLGFVIFSALPSQAQVGSSARYFQQVCLSDKTVEQLACNTYIMGWLDGLFAATVQTKQFAICGTPNVETAKTVFLNWVDGANEATLNTPVGIILLAALGKRYPC